jgi:uncharacterized iron-regulated membrane protein
LLISLITGIHMYNPWTDWIDRGVNRLSPVTRLASEPAFSQPTAEGQMISAEQAVRIAASNIANGHPSVLALPLDERGVLSISLKTGAVWESEVTIDQYSGKLLHVSTPKDASASDHFLAWLFPLHTGSAFGLPGRILILILGLVPTVLFVTGTIRWRQKLRAHKVKVYKGG